MYIQLYVKITPSHINPIIDSIKNASIIQNLECIYYIIS
jgi:hypothetical protein